MKGVRTYEKGVQRIYGIAQPREEERVMKRAIVNAEDLWQEQKKRGRRNGK